MAAESTPAVVKHADDVHRNEIPVGRSASNQVLIGPADGAPNFALRRFTMGAGGGVPLHTNTVEHEQYVLEGRARLVLGDEVREVGKGDCLYIPAGLPHSYEVLDGPFEFLCIVPNGEDRMELLDGAC